MKTESKLGGALVAPPRAAWVAFGVLGVVYLVALIVRLAGGPAVMDVTGVVPWSCLIAFFFLLAGAGGGLLAAGAAASLGLLPSLVRVQQRVYLAAVACFVAAGLTVLIDLGRPERVLNMLISIHLSSPFAWDFLFLALSVVLGAVASVRRPGKVLACCAAVAGAAVLLVEGVILVVCAGHGFWHGALVPVLFLLEGLIAGLALIVVAAPGVGRRVALTLTALLGVLVLFNVAEWVYAYAPGTDAAASLALLVSGPLAPLYWLQVIAGALVPAALLVAVPGRSAVRAAGALSLVGIVLAKFAILLAGQSLDILGVYVAYLPSLLDVALSAGAVGLAGLLFLAGVRLIPAGEAYDGAAPAASAAAPQGSEA